MTLRLPRHCEPCAKGTPPLPKAEVKKLLRHLKGWHLADRSKALEQEFLMKNFLAARDLINRIAQVAEKEDHHPDLHLTSYRKLRIVLSTHSIGGLSKNDFILAAKIDRLPKKLKSA